MPLDGAHLMNARMIRNVVYLFGWVLLVLGGSSWTTGVGPALPPP